MIESFRGFGVGRSCFDALGGAGREVVAAAAPAAAALAEAAARHRHGWEGAGDTVPRAVPRRT